MSERWRQELAKVERVSPDLERLRGRARQPSASVAYSGSPRSRLVAIVIALVVFALAASVFVVPMLFSSGGEPTPTPTVSPSPPLVPGAPKADAVAEARRLVELTEVPPGSERSDRATVRSLRYPDAELSCATEPCRTAIDAAGWWSMPLPMDDAVAWLQQHPPYALYATGEHSSGVDASGVVTSLSWTYAERPALAYTIAELTFTVVPDGLGRSALRADGQVLWVPPRTDREHLPDTLDHARIQAYRGTRLIATRALNGAAARALVGLLNHAGRSNMGPPRCRFESDRALHYTMTFARHGSFTFTDWIGCRNGPTIFVQVNGRQEPTLTDGSALTLGWGVTQFLQCELGDDPIIGCLVYVNPSSPLIPSELVGLCQSLARIDVVVSTAIAHTYPDENAAARGIQEKLPDVMTLVQASEQAITDSQTRAAADDLMTDLSAIQAWPGTAGSLRSLLDAVWRDSASFSAAYCR